MLVRVAQPNEPVGGDHELRHGAPRIVDGWPAVRAPVVLEAHPELVRVAPILGGRVEQHTLDRPVPDAVSPVRGMARIAQDGARQIVLGTVGGGSRRLALRNDHRLETGVLVLAVLSLQALSPGNAATAPEVAPEHDQRRSVGPELGKAAPRTGVVGKGKVGRPDPCRQSCPFALGGTRRPPVQPFRLGRSRQLCQQGHRSRLLGVFTDGEDLVGDKPMSLPVYGVGRFRVGRLDKAEDLPRRRVHPVAEIVHPVRALGREIGLVGGGDVTRRHPSLDTVYVHEKWHVRLFPSVAVRPVLAVTNAVIR